MRAEGEDTEDDRRLKGQSLLVDMLLQNHIKSEHDVIHYLLIAICRHGNDWKVFIYD